MSKPAGRGHGPMGHGPMVGEKAKNFKGSIKKLFIYLAKYKFAFLLVIIFAVGSTIFSIIGPTILGDATTSIYNGLMSKISGGSGIDFNELGSILLTLGALYVTSAMFSFMQGFITSGISQKMTYRMRREISEKINRLPMNYYDTKTHGEILSRVTNDVDTLSQSLNQSMTQLITSIATVIGVLVMMLRISFLMTIVALVIMPISIVMVSIIVKKSQKYFKQQQEYLGHINGQVEEVFGGHNVIKAFNKEEDTLKTFRDTNEILYHSAWKSQFLSGMMQPIMMFVGNLSYVAVSILGGYLALKGTIEVGQIQSFIQYVRSFNQPIAQLAQVANMLQSTAAAAERIFEFLDEEEEEQVASHHASVRDYMTGMDRNIRINELEGRVIFDHVKFGYSPEKIIVKDFSANVKFGQKIAIVGPTGAGKTTMIKLLMRYYDVNSGAVLIDDYNVKEFDRSELREMFGMVLQDTWLFHGTIRENIRYGRLDATNQEIIEAAKAAHAHHFISALPGGYDMVLDEEASNISQGQKQLLTIARAILANNRILILDEATSSVDTRTEQQIQKAMNNLMEGRTSFVIAHRLSTIRDADLILVMKDGDIIEQGSHNELMNQDGFYAQLYLSQFEQG